MKLSLCSQQGKICLQARPRALQTLTAGQVTIWIGTEAKLLGRNALLECNSQAYTQQRAHLAWGA